MSAARMKPLRIGGLAIEPPVIPAPMCGISDRAWRILAREQGCSFAFTQMVSSEALLHEHQKSWRLLDLEGEEGPVGVQLFGCKPQDLGVAARMLQDAGAALVDLNIGCPARKIVKVRGGSALLREPEVVREILHEMRAALSIPLTIKIRAGWEQYGPEAFHITEIAEGEGVDAITIHARTRAQGFKGQADWSIIAELKRRTRLPVIGNGDIRSGADGVRMMRETGCDGVMVGRGIIGNPWLIGDLCRSIRHADLAKARAGAEAAGAVVDQAPDQPAAQIAGQTAHQADDRAAPSLPERIEMMRRHARLMAERRGVPRGLIEFRKHAVQYLRGIRGSHTVKMTLMRTQTLEALDQALEMARERAGADGWPDEPSPGGASPLSESGAGFDSDSNPDCLSDSGDLSSGPDSPLESGPDCLNDEGGETA